MNFQIQPLQYSDFAHLFELSDAELATQNACRQTVTASPGTPCRVSMQDAQIGETVILANYQHQPEASPYQATHAIFVRKNAPQAQPAQNDVPDVIRNRLISLRYFDRSHLMIDADVVDGKDVARTLAEAFENADIAYIHIHNAKPGCYAASAYRAS